MRFIVLGVVLVCWCVFHIALAVFIDAAPTRSTSCREYLANPTYGRLELKGCRLAIDELLVGNADNVERFALRVQGLSHSPYLTPPEWTKAWAPLTTDDIHSMRVLYRFNDVDLLRWINAVEQASGQQRKALYQRDSILRRLVEPGLLMGVAQRPSPAGMLQQATNRHPRAKLVVIEGGTVPETSFPLLAIVVGIIGVFLILGAAVRSMRGSGSGAQQHF